MVQFSLFQLNYTDECYFKENLTDDGLHTLYSSYKYSGEKPKRNMSHNSKNSKDSSTTRGKPWYLGLKANGIMKGYRTDITNMNVWFLPEPRREAMLKTDPHRPVIPTPPLPFGNNSVRQPQNKRGRGTGSPFNSGGLSRTRGGRKRKCNEVFVFPVLEGCRTKGRRRQRHRHGAAPKHRSPRKHKKPRERHRRGKKQLF